MTNRTRVEVTNISHEDIETDSFICEENVRLKLNNTEEVSFFSFNHYYLSSYFLRKSQLDLFYVILNKIHVELDESLMHK
jgi:hypothetical protein